MLKEKVVLSELIYKNRVKTKRVLHKLGVAKLIQFRCANRASVRKKRENLVD